MKEKEEKQKKKEKNPMGTSDQLSKAYSNTHCVYIDTRIGLKYWPRR